MRYVLATSVYVAMVVLATQVLRFHAPAAAAAATLAWPDAAVTGDVPSRI